MKKISVISLVLVLGVFLVAGCGKKANDVEYNTFDNNTSEEYIDPETGANLKETIEDVTEESGIVPDDDSTDGDPEETLVINDESENATEEGGEVDESVSTEEVNTDDPSETEDETK